MNEAVIASIARTAVGKAPRGTLRSTRPDDMAATVIQDVIRRVPGLDRNEIEDVILGCAMPEAEQGFNVARVALLRAGLPVECAAMTINRFCCSGLQAIVIASEHIKAGSADVIVAGGTESMSMIPMGGFHFSPNPYLMEHYPDSYLSMGLTAETLARKHGITREDSDAFALRSHQRALAAIAECKFKDEIVPLEVVEVSMNGKNRPEKRTISFSVDEGPRRDTSMEALAKLKPAFHAHGTVTAGNASQMSDGAAAAVVMSMEKAQSLGVKPLARFVSFATAGTLPEEMGVGPVYAIPKALKLAGLKLADIDLIELNEAFAVQALAVIKLASLDPEKTNVNGGAVALGHPLGCTGAKLTATLLGEMKRRKSRYGMVSMCAGSWGQMSKAESFARLYSRVGRNSKIAGVGFMALSILFLILSVYDPFIVYEVDSVVAFLIAAVLLFRDPRVRVQAGVLDAMQLSSGQTIAELTSDADGYVYLPLGEDVEDVVVVPNSPSSFSLPKGGLRPSQKRITPPGRALATLFLRESGLTNATVDGLAASLPRIVREDLGLADSLSIREKGDRVEVTLHGPASVCRRRSGETNPASRGVVGCTVASFLAVLYSSASMKLVVLEDCTHDEATDTWSIGLNLGPAARVTV